MIGRVISAVWTFFKTFRLAFVVAVIAGAFFFVALFPFGDLADFVTSKVSEATQNRIYLQMETLNFGFIPSPSISGTNVQVEAAELPTLKANWIKISPSLLDIIANVGNVVSAARGNLAASQKLSNQVGVSVSAEGLLGGDMDLQMKPGGKNEQGALRSKIYLEMDQLDLSEIPKAFNFPLAMNGRADVVSNLRVYPNFEDQPDGDVELKAKSVKIPASTVPTPLGPLAMPPMNFGEITFKGKMAGGTFIIEEANLGRSSDPLHGRIKGQMAIRFQKMGPNVVPVMGAYDLKIDLELTSAAEKDFSLITGLISGYRTQSPRGSRYLLQVHGANTYGPPEITQSSTF
jgi:type II secretion system protein N